MEFFFCFKPVDLVESHQHWDVGGIQFGEHFVDSIDLCLRLRMTNVNDMEQQDSFCYLFQRRFERGNQLVRQLLDKSDGVA